MATKFGPIPCSWKYCRIETFCQMKSGDGITSKEIKKSGRFPCYGGNGLRGYVDKYTHSGKYVLIGRQGALCGNVKLVDGQFFASEHAVVTQNLPNSDINFIYFLLDNMKLNRYSESSAQPGLSVEKILRQFIVLPYINEQQKIAEILTTQDKIIELKENLLTEKQRQKKCLMQQLLTGKKRLPGFSRGWSFPKAKEIFRSISDKDHNGDLMVLSSTQDRGIVPRDEVDIDIKYNTSSLINYKKVCKGHFVISLRSFQGGIEYSAYTGLVSPAYTVLTPKRVISDEYYKQFFKSTDYIKRLNVAIYGIRDGKQISYEDFGRLWIPYPPIEEQTAIAEVLSTADRELDLLRQEIEQEKQKKKALMQLLLTGIVRV